MTTRIPNAPADPNWGCERSYIVAEIGVNHGGDVGLAREMVDAAVEAGADAAKFQTFRAAALALRSTPKVGYQRRVSDADESHFDMLEKLELSPAAHGELLEHCGARGVDFLSTPYDIESVRFLDELGVELFKTASADLVDLPLHRSIAETGKPVLIATGMASLGEVERTVELYRKAGRTIGDLTLLHCVSNYPCSDESLNLRALTVLGSAFGARVGLSDHSEGAVAAVAARTLGALVFEKHFTLDKSLRGPDHCASADPSGFKEFVIGVRRVELMLGAARKERQPEEEDMAVVSRKSLTIARPVAAHDVIELDDLTSKRPGTGIPPDRADEVVGRRARRELAVDSVVEWSDLE